MTILLIVGWTLDTPTERMVRGLTIGFGVAFAASLAFMLNRITSFWFTGAALAGWLAYWHRLDRLAEIDTTRLLRTKHAMAWLMFAAVLEETLKLATRPNRASLISGNTIQNTQPRSEAQNLIASLIK